MSRLFTHAVACALDGTHRRLGIGRPGEGDAGMLGGKIDGGRVHARHRFQRALDPTDAGCARHALDRQTQAHLPRTGWVGPLLMGNRSHCNTP